VQSTSLPSGSKRHNGGSNGSDGLHQVIFHFGVPHSIITDNGSNFTSGEFKEYCEKLGIQLKFASVAHPQTNGQGEKANGLVCSGIKKRLLTPLK
jgi:transposase InsO family protein